MRYTRLRFTKRAQKLGGLADPKYIKARAEAKRLAGAEGIDKLITENNLDALISPSYGPAYRTEVVTGDHSSGDSSSLPAVAGYPHLTVPMGTLTVNVVFHPGNYEGVLNESHRRGCNNS